MSQVFEALGKPDGERGSGIYIYEYDLADGTRVWIGSGDRSRIMYVRHVGTSNDDVEVLYEQK